MSDRRAENGGRSRELPSRETPLLNRIRKAASRAGARLFRNQVGHYKLVDGRRITSGLQPGSSDLIGWVPVEITPDMVGQTVAVFASIEVKGPQGRLSTQQQRWIQAVREAGGYAGVAKTPGDAMEILQGR